MIQHWTPDTTTQSRWMGGQALAAGISGGTKSLADSIGAAMEQRKQENVRAKASETLFKSTPELQDALGMDEEQFKGLSSAEKNELVKSGIGKISLMESLAREKQQREAFNMQQRDYSRRQADELGFNRAVREQMQINPQSPELGNFYENPEQYPQGRPTSRQPGLMEVLGAAAQHNQLGSPQLDNLMNSLSRAQPKAEFDPTQALPIQGTQGHRVVQTSAGQYQVIPPDKADKPLLSPYPGQNSDNLDEKIAGIRSISDPEQRRLAIEEANNMEVLKGRPSMLEKLLMGNLDGGKGPAKPAGTQASPYLPKTTAEAAKLKPGEWFKTPDGRLIQRK